MFPAHAGMNRAIGASAAIGQCVFPAHAGMNRTTVPSIADVVRVFPAHAGMNRLRIELGCEHAVVFPAHAGMNRGTAPDQRLLPCVPRTRGDEPFQSARLRTRTISVCRSFVRFG